MRNSKYGIPAYPVGHPETDDRPSGRERIARCGASSICRRIIRTTVCVRAADAKVFQIKATYGVAVSLEPAIRKEGARAAEGADVAGFASSRNCLDFRCRFGAAVLIVAESRRRDRGGCRVVGSRRQKRVVLARRHLRRITGVLCSPDILPCI